MNIIDLSSYLASQPANTKDTPYLIALKIDSDADFKTIREVLNSKKNKYVCLNLSGSNATTIPNNAFSSTSTLTGITIPDGVTVIEHGVFWGCNNLTSITIPDSVISIEESTFDSCTSLKSVTIPNGVTVIENNAFGGCTSLTSITIPDNVTSIGDRAFISCNGLTSITIPDSVTNIGERSFCDCTGLTSITIPDSVTNIGERSFCDCTGLTSITIPDSVISIREGSFSDCTGLTSVTIPSSVISIGKGAFSACTGLTAINVAANNSSYTSEDGVLYTKDKTALIMYPVGKTDLTFIILNSVTSIKRYAFADCASLASVTIPSNVISIGKGAFSACTGLTEINVATDNSSYASEDGVLYNKDKTALIKYPLGKTDLAFIIPPSVTSIVDHAFAYCTSLDNVTIQNSVTSIGKGVFSGCSLTAINVAADNSSYASEDGVLYNKDKTVLIKIPSGKTGNFTIPDSVNDMDIFTFFDCDYLVSITILNNVIGFANGAFSSCPSLVAINVNSDNSDYASEDGVLYDKDKTYLFACPPGKTGAFIIPNGVIIIGEAAFINSSLTSITIPDSVTRILDCAFIQCTRLRSITIPKSVTSIRYHAFQGCTNLASVTFEGTIHSKRFFTGHEPFDGDLRDKFYATDPVNGTPGTYTTTAPVDENSVWTKQ